MYSKCHTLKAKKYHCPYTYNETVVVICKLDDHVCIGDFVQIACLFLYWV